jgi:hypothetical protein
MTTRLYVIGILCIGAVAGSLLDLTVELTGHPWWFLLMMLICALSPGPVAFAAAIDGTDHIINLRSRLSLPGWIKPVIVLLLVVSTLGVIRIAGINPRAYAYVPLLLPVIASSILFGFSYGLLALIACTLAADYFFALPVYDFSFGEIEDAIGLAIFAIFGAAAAWIIDEIREPSS